MDVESLRLFVEVARRGSFAAVARDRDADPSSVSRAVAALEVELGLRLFQRSTRRLALTEAGALYLARVEAVADEVERAREEALAVSTGPVGRLRLTASVAFGQRCLVPLVPEFRASFPALGVELLLTDANLDLVAERVDLAVRLGPPIEAEVVGTKLSDTRYRVCAAPAYLARAGSLRVPDDLREHRCLLFTLPEFRSRWLFRRGGEVRAVPVSGDVIASSALALRDLALAGSGPALLADWLIGEDIGRGLLVDLFPRHQVTATSFDTAAWLLYPNRSFLPNKVRVAIDFLKRRLG